MRYNEAKILILGYLWDHESVTAKELARYRGTSESGASTQLGTFYRWGLVSRYKIKGQGKTYHYDITEDGCKRYIYLQKHKRVKPQTQSLTKLPHHHEDQIKKSGRKKREWYDVEKCPITPPVALPSHHEDMKNVVLNIDPTRIVYASESLDISNLVKKLMQSS